jgi:hypothetical protein
LRGVKKKKIQVERERKENKGLVSEIMKEKL